MKCFNIHSKIHHLRRRIKRWWGDIPFVYIVEMYASFMWRKARLCALTVKEDS